MYALIHRSPHTHARTHTHTHTSKHTHARTHTHTLQQDTNIHTNMNAHTYLLYMYTKVHKRHAHAHNHVHACTHTHTHAHLLLTQMYMPFCMTREVLAHFSLIRLLLKCKYSLRSVTIWSRLTRSIAMSINNIAIISPRPTLFNSPSWLNTTH